MIETLNQWLDIAAKVFVLVAAAWAIYRIGKL